MCTLLEMRKRIEAVDIIQQTGKAIRQTENHLVEWQKDQLYTGKKKTGGRITPGYRPLTKKIKKAKGQPIDRVTLKDTGSFYEGIVVDVGATTYRLYSTDSKSTDLTAKYGEAIWGLNKVSRQGYVEQNLQPVVIRNVKRELKV